MSGVVMAANIAPGRIVRKTRRTSDARRQIQIGPSAAVVTDLPLRDPPRNPIVSRPMTDHPDELRNARNHLAETILSISRVLAASPPADVDELSRACDLLADAQGRLARYDVRLRGGASGGVGSRG
jgi:hypothetical protein